MTDMERLLAIKKIRARRAERELARTRARLRDLVRQRDAQARVRRERADRLRDYLATGFADLGNTDGASTKYTTLSLGLYRRKRDIMLAELRRRRLVSDVLDCAEEADELARRWQGLNGRRTELERRVAQDRADADACRDLAAEEDLTELINQKVKR